MVSGFIELIKDYENNGGYMKYKIYLKAGQQAPEGALGINLTDGGLVWEGDEKDVPTKALLGNRLPTDPEFATEYDVVAFKDEDEKEYTQLQDFLKIEQPELITFDEFRAADKTILEAKIADNTTKLTAITAAKVATDAKVSAEVVKGK
jgi:hypothetical protein